MVYICVDSIDRVSEKRFMLGRQALRRGAMLRQKKRQLSDVQISSPIRSFGNLFFGFIVYCHYVILIHLQVFFYLGLHRCEEMPV